MEIEEVRQFLKKNFDGPEVVKALTFRLETHLKDPTLDPLSNQVWGAYQQLSNVLREPFSLLDAGCMSGFLYHHLKKSFNDFTYTGMDRWAEALEVGKTFAPEVSFVKRDFMNDSLDDIQQHDYVVCSNIPFINGDEAKALENLAPLARRSLIMIHPGSRMQIFE